MKCIKHRGSLFICIPSGVDSSFESAAIQKKDASFHFSGFPYWVVVSRFLSLRSGCLLGHERLSASCFSVCSPRAIVGVPVSRRSASLAPRGCPWGSHALQEAKPASGQVVSWEGRRRSGPDAKVQPAGGSGEAGASAQWSQRVLGGRGEELKVSEARHRRRQG